jgi:hypothetical protein
MKNTRSALLVNPTPREISIEKPNKIKRRRRRRISNPKLRSVFEVPKDSLNYRRCEECEEDLNRAQAHDELNVLPCHREVQEGANHAPILSGQWPRHSHLDLVPLPCSSELARA